MAVNLFDNNQYKNKELIRCSYSHGGGMLGDVYNITVTKKDDKAELSINQASSHVERMVTKTYTIDSAVFDDLKQIMIDYNLIKVSKKGNSPFEVLDGPSTSISYTFADYDSFRIGDYQNLNNNDYEAIEKVKKTILSYINTEPVISIQPHELSLSVDGYNLIYYMNESKAAEQLVELNDKYMFSSYNDNGKMFHLQDKLDISDCPLADGSRIGVITYYEPNDDVIVFYREFKFGEIKHIIQLNYTL